MPNRLPQLPSPAMQLDDALGSPRHQLHFIYKPKDARKIQSLDPVFTLDDLRRTGVVGSRDIRSHLAYPGLSPNFLNEPMEGVSDDDRDEYEDGVSDGRSVSSMGKGHGRALQRGPSPEQGPGRIDPLRYSATAAARTVLMHEKPAVVERMEKGVAACAVLRDNRRFRLFSLGVFQPGVNDVRTRSMHRVELHKHLSSTNLRAPQPDKEVRSAVHNDTVGARLERMYHRVLRAVDDSAPPSPPLGSGNGTGHGLSSGQGAGALGSSGGGGARRQSPSGMAPGVMLGRSASLVRWGPGDMEGRMGPAQQHQNQHQQQQQIAGAAGGQEMTRGPVLGRSTSIVQRLSGPQVTSGGPVGPGPGSGGAGGNGGGTGGGACGGPRSLFSTMPSMARNGGGPPAPQQQQPNQAQLPTQPPGSPSGNAHSADYWMRVTLPPEVIEAQLRHLAASTEANLKAYHDKVALAQDDLLRSNGLSTEALGMPSEIVEQSLKVKLGQIQEDTTVNNFNYSSLSRDAVLASQLGPASKQLLTATTLPQFIRAALDHVQQHKGELAQLKSTWQQPDEGRRRSVHRRARTKSSVANILPLGAVLPGSVGRTDGDADSYRTLCSERTNTVTGDGGGGSPDGYGTQDGSSESGMWPSYMPVKQRATSAGAQLTGGGTTADPTIPSSSAGQSQGRVTEDVEAAHLEHLRRHASPDSAAREPRWSPPAPVLAGNARAHTAPPPMQPPQPSSQLGRRTGSFIDEEWMTKFRVKLHAVEAIKPDGPPDGLLPLPPLPPINMDAGTYVRLRLERLWSQLDVPPPQQLDLVLAFTGRDRALQFARNLELWEQAAVAVLGRETQVEALVASQREIEKGRADMLSLSTVEALCVRVLEQTRWVEELSTQLRAACSWELSYHGKPYPGKEAITSMHLLAFMEQLRQVTQITGLRP